MLFAVNIDLNKNELQNAVIQPLASAPSNPKAGQVYYNSGDKIMYQYDGSAWKAVGAVVSVNNKTGAVTLLQDDIGDGWIYKRTHNDLTDGLVALINGALQKSGGTMTGDIAMASHSITGLAAPTNNGDAATKKYVDDTVSGLGAVFNFKGTKSATSELPTTGNKQGDVWLVSADDSEYVWTSSSSSGTSSDWEKLGVTVDLSGYLQKSGGTMSGAIAMGNNKITGLANGTAATDAAAFGQIPTASTATPAMDDGTGNAGSSPSWAKGDHVHPTDTSRQAKITASGVLQGDGNGGVTAKTVDSTPTADSTNLVTSGGVASAISALTPVQSATGTIGTSATSASVSYTGTVVNAYATQGSSNEIIMCDIAIGSSAVTFTVAAAPSSAITCVVIYA